MSEVTVGLCTSGARLKVTACVPAAGGASCLYRSQTWHVYLLANFKPDKEVSIQGIYDCVSACEPMCVNTSEPVSLSIAEKEGILLLCVLCEGMLHAC